MGPPMMAAYPSLHGYSFPWDQGMLIAGSVCDFPGVEIFSESDFNVVETGFLYRHINVLSKTGGAAMPYRQHGRDVGLDARSILRHGRS